MDTGTSNNTLLSPKSVRGYLKLAYQIALASEDESTQNGVVLVGSNFTTTGWNQTTKGIPYSRVQKDPSTKYDFVEHAERSVIYKAARMGYSTNGSVLFAPWSACSDCARAIVQANISTVYRLQKALDHSPERWLTSIELGDEILLSGGVRVVSVEGDLDGPEVRFNGEIWRP